MYIEEKLGILLILRTMGTNILNQDLYFSNLLMYTLGNPLVQSALPFPSSSKIK